MELKEKPILKYTFSHQVVWVNFNKNPCLLGHFWKLLIEYNRNCWASAS